MICATTSESELTYEWRVLVEVAIPNPRRPHHEVDDPRPTHSLRAVRPSLKICLLVPLQFRCFEFFTFALVLDSSLARPPAVDNKRTGGPGDEIRIFARTLDRIEDNLQLLRDRYSYQSRLRSASLADCAENAKSAFRHERVKVNVSHQ